MTHKLSNFLKKLGYTFKKPELLEAALTHCSVPGGNNERLEFFGDSIINFLIAEHLYEKFPKAKEGDLSCMRASFVRGDTLALIAKELDLGEYLRLGPGEYRSGGQRRASILADSLEALIAAIYLDGGLDKVRQTILPWFASRVEDADILKKAKDPKTRLQEFLQAHKYALPKYTILAVEGTAHQQLFHLTCTVEGLQQTSQGVGTSRRRAEQDAAAKLLLILHAS